MITWKVNGNQLIVSGTAEEILGVIGKLQTPEAGKGVARSGRKVVRQSTPRTKITSEKKAQILSWLRSPGTIDMNLKTKRRYRAVVLRGAELFEVSSYQVQPLYRMVLTEMESGVH